MFLTRPSASGRCAVNLGETQCLPLIGSAKSTLSQRDIEMKSMRSVQKQKASLTAKPTLHNAVTFFTKGYGSIYISDYRDALSLSDTKF